ncbi:sensor histidine kinase [Chitinophaga arvensicola]|uniref:Histidine kinase n=1 Tax=Chitinophaga arvensicola TaxID=29529 RepID=A0A1I0REW7_9BACT|nr:histidine kinase [Chitinophaga arvensicola]SEW39303.1 Histidine kinase [Chitinophaga arvensicola]
MNNHRQHIRQFLLLLLIWMILVYGVNLLMAGRFTMDVFRHMSINDGLFGFINFFAFYIYFRWIIPPFLEHRNLLRLFARIIPVLLGFIALKYTVAKLFFEMDTLYRGYRIEDRQRVEIFTTPAQYLVSGLWSGAVIVLAAFAARFFILWLQEDQRRHLLQQQQQQAEAAFLKMQLNSHFLINSLNSIYSLALVGSPEVVTANKTLTDLLAYMVDQPSDIAYRVPIADEVRYLQDFVALQRIRTGRNEGVVFNVPECLPEKKIAPLLLVPFVENAFKHGISNRPEKPVRIDLQCNGQQLEFTVHNYMSGTHRDKTGGIGLENVSKRLQLMYPDEHLLEITATQDEYYSKLVINW